MSERATSAQAFLLAEGGPLAIKRLAQRVGCSESELTDSLAELQEALEGSGISLIQTASEVSLSTSPRATEAVRKHFEDALTREIGNAGLEVLAIVLYRGASSRARIDYIRGVNTSSTIRSLLSRGLLERVPNPEDGREYLYRPTAELLAHLGARNEKELPEYDTIGSELAAFEKTRTAFDHDGGDTTAADELD